MFGAEALKSWVSPHVCDGTLCLVWDSGRDLGASDFISVLVHVFPIMHSLVRDGVRSEGLESHSGSFQSVSCMLFLVVSKHVQCSSRVYIHTLEYYLAIKKNTFESVMK